MAFTEGREREREREGRVVTYPVVLTEEKTLEVTGMAEAAEDLCRSSVRKERGKEGGRG